MSFKALRARAGLPDAATIESLNAVDWYALKARWPKSDDDWFQLRAAVSHFLAVQLGNGKAKKGVHHPWRVAVMDTDNFPTVKPTERVPDLDVPTFWRIVNQTPKFVQPCYVTIAYLGLRVGEYLRLTDTDKLPATQQVHIPGAKTPDSKATLPVAPEMWPWITAAIPSPLRYGWLRRYWVRARKAVGADSIRLHDLRHLPAMALTDAGRSEASVQTTMRHATAAMTRRYARQRDRGENARVLANIMLGAAS